MGAPALRSIVLWVLAEPGDPSLALLEPAPPGVRVVVGAEPEAFDDAPRPDVVFDCWSGPRRVRGVLARVPDLEWLHSRSAGLEGVLVPELAASPATVTNGRGAFSQSLAEFALAGLLFFLKDLRRLVRSQEAGEWDQFDPDMLHGRTLGIVGYGDIGRATAALAHSLGVRILALRRRPELSREDSLLEDVLPVERLGEALEQGRIRGAALDVFETEPLPAGHPFWRLPNVLLSPHSADHVPGWIEDGTRVFLRNLDRFRRGEPLLNVVDKARGY
jgi:phosphoglycerate dehydrogenase-like enzyme